MEVLGSADCPPHGTSSIPLSGQLKHGDGHCASSQPSEGTHPVLITNQARVDPAHARLLRGELDGAQAALDPVFLVPAE
ncbi:hypothetical protein DEH18_12720 [Streptomyces sp. NHF165]|nr:hypothetical protein DEH18_12720 [Streptomyces sp. NHF165]